MPNWCSNKLIITGPEEDLARFVRQARGPTSSYNNILDSKSWEVFDDIRIASICSMNPEPGEVSDLSFHALCPVPEEIRRLGFDGKLAKKAAETLGVEFPGMGGAGWQRANWGTKWEPNVWGVYVDDCDYIEYCFDTAWTPPDALVEKISIDWPTLTFRLEYEEPAMNFAGCYEYHNGELTFSEEKECSYYDDEE